MDKKNLKGIYGASGRNRKRNIGSIIDEKIKLYYLPVSKRSSLKVVFWAIPIFGRFKDLMYPQKDLS